MALHQQKPSHYETGSMGLKRSCLFKYVQAVVSSSAHFATVFITLTKAPALCQSSSISLQKNLMKIAEVIRCLENFAPVSLQEGYDNAGLIIGNADGDCKGIITTLDVTEEVVAEAVSKKCNLIVAHHPIIFKGLKR